MAFEQPPPLRHNNPLALAVADLAEERAGRVPYPPGETSFSPARTKRFVKDAGGLLIECHERYGPIFTLRIAHRKMVFMIGPAANHYMTVANASNFTIRESLFSTLIGIIGDGLLTTDGEFHRRMRRVMLPALHSESIVSYVDTIVDQTERAIETIELGQPVDFYLWSYKLILRISMSALFGIDPDGERARSGDLVDMFDRIHAMPLTLSTSSARNPLTRRGRFMRLVRRLDRVLYSEIAERRARGGGGTDIMSLLIDAHDEDGDSLTDVQIRDQVMTLLMASTGATTTAMALLLYQLACHPEVVERIVAEQDAKLDGSHPSGAQLKSGELVELGMACEEALRMYPAAWIGPRRATESFEFEGVEVPANAYVHFSPLASHYLPDVFPEPECYRPERFEPQAKAALPKGALAPFGGGSRTCIGARFAQLELQVVTSVLIKRFELEPPADFSLELSQMPVLRPKDDLPLIVSERAVRSDRIPVLSG